MARTDTGTHTSGSLTAVAAALQAIAARLTRTADAMKEKGVAALEIKSQAGMKDGIAALRSFGMAAEEALETWIFDQHVFTAGSAEPATDPAQAKSEAPVRKSKKQPPAPAEDSPDA